jgi:hypothetical protein
MDGLGLAGFVKPAGSSAVVEVGDGPVVARSTVTYRTRQFAGDGRERRRVLVRRRQWPSRRCALHVEARAMGRPARSRTPVRGSLHGRHLRDRAGLDRGVHRHRDARAGRRTALGGPLNGWRRRRKVARANARTTTISTNGSTACFSIPTVSAPRCWPRTVSWHCIRSTCSEAGFRHQNLMVFQIQLAKRQDAVPITRDYITRAEARLHKREQRRSMPVRLAGE